MTKDPATNHSERTQPSGLIRQTAFDALGYGLSAWSSDERLLCHNISFQERFQPIGLKLTSSLSLEEFLQHLSASGLIVLASRQSEWVSSELVRCRSLENSEYTFRDGTVDLQERWPLPGGGFICLSREVTAQLRDQRLLKRAMDDAKAADVSKSRFLRAANHDLRQPLASLKILIYNCMSAESEEQRAELLHAMDVSVSIMEDLLGALLNIGQLDAGVVTPRISTFQIAALFERLQVEYEHQARERGLRLSFVPSKQAVVSDRVLLERIVSNFVSNALNYTETGGVVVGCRRDGNHLNIEVHDTGKGIAGEHLDEIFKEFFRCSDDQATRKHSLGLGLNIAKRLSDVLEHPIKVKSTEDLGSVFSIRVPLGDVWHSDIGEHEITERIGGEFMGLHALVLEDDKNLRSALCDLLERWGMKVSSDGHFDPNDDVWKRLETAPDIIVTDFRLQSGVEGTSLVRKIESHFARKCPAIVVTADTEPRLIESIRKSGFPVLIKPVSPPSLRVMMHNVLYEPDLLDEKQMPSNAREDGYV